MQKAPVEGPMTIACEIDWGSMGGTNKCVSFNPATSPSNPQQISQILMLKIDNSECGADVQFIFPDTGDTVTVDAYSPNLVTPVFTQGTFFYVLSPSAESEDITRFQILNFLAPPISEPSTFEQETAVFNDIENKNGTTQLIPDTVSGSIETLTVYVTVTDASATQSMTYELEDGNSNVIAGAQVAITEGDAVNTMAISFQTCRIRFQQGLSLAIAGGGTQVGWVSVNVLYRTP